MDGWRSLQRGPLARGEYRTCMDEGISPPCSPDGGRGVQEARVKRWIRSDALCGFKVQTADAT